MMTAGAARTFPWPTGCWKSIGVPLTERGPNLTKPFEALRATMSAAARVESEAGLRRRPEEMSGHQPRKADGLTQSQIAAELHRMTQFS